MNIVPFSAVLFALFAFPHLRAAEDADFVPVASYVTEHDGKRLKAILHDHKIESTYSAPTTNVIVSVPETQATEALRLLAHVIVDERLNITLLAMNVDSGRSIVVTPESILDSTHPKQTTPSATR